MVQLGLQLVVALRTNLLRHVGNIELLRGLLSNAISVVAITAPGHCEQADLCQIRCHDFGVGSNQWHLMTSFAKANI